MRAVRGSSLLALAATAVVLAGCGSSSTSSSSGVSAAQYAKTICTAVNSFQKDAQSRVGTLSASTNLAAHKQALQAAFAAVAADAGQALSQLQAAGVPNMTNGKATSAALIAGFSQVKNALSHAAILVGRLPTTSQSAFKSGATPIAAAVEASLANLGNSLSGLKSPDFDKAAAAEPACKSLTA
jgi:hypothetical protein